MWWATTAILILIPLLYYLLARGIPSRRCPEQAPRSKSGVVQVDGTRSGLGTQLRGDGVDIIFVHGLGANPDFTWRARPPPVTTAGPRTGTAEDDKIGWVTDLLVDDLPPVLRRKTRIFFYNHDSYWIRDAPQTRLWNLAGNMLHHLREGVRRTEDEQMRGLVFVAHSYGGLFVKQTLVRAKNEHEPALRDIATRTKGIIFLGTPHRGSTFSQLGSVAASIFRPLGSDGSILQEIMYDSLSLQDLHEQFTHTMGAGLAVYNFFEERPTCLVDLGFLQWTKMCVEEQSAKYFDSSQQVHNIGLAVDHSGLNKFGSRTAQYEVVRDKLVGLLPPAPRDVYSVSAHRVDSYISREELSRRLHENLQPSQGKDAQLNESDVGVGAFRGVIVHGMGGVGKTQLALKFAEDHRGFYDPIFWIDAQTPETVRMSFERGAVALGLTFDDASTADSSLKDSAVVTGVLRWFLERDEDDQQWLVIVDNADDTSWRVDEFIPQGPQGHVIVTSQYRQSPNFLGGDCMVIHVEDMARDEARALLKKRVEVGRAHASTEMDRLYDQVVGQLGCLALAVDLAGAYLSEQVQFDNGDAKTPAEEKTIITVLRQYLADYEQHQDTLLQWKPSPPLSSYEKTVWTVWDTTLAAIERTHPRSHASQLLTFVAHFQSGSMEEEMFRLASRGWTAMMRRLELRDEDTPEWLRQMVGSINQGWDDFHYRQATQLLVRYGLLQRLGGKWPRVTMHGLVQWRARRAQEGSNSRWRQWTWQFMAAAVRESNHATSQAHSRRHVLAHILEMGEVKAPQSGDSEVNESCLYRLRWDIVRMYRHNGRWSEAEKLGIKVVETRKRVLGEEHRNTLTSINNLASTYAGQGRLSEAEMLQIEVMETRKRVLGEEHLQTLSSIHNLALIYLNQGRSSEAEKLQIEVMETRKRVLGEEHLHTLSSIHNLASIYLDQERLSEAEKLQREVIETRKKVLGDEHPDTLTTMHNLAFTLHAQDRNDEAVQLLSKCVSIRSRILGENHPRTLDSSAALIKWQNDGMMEESLAIEESEQEMEQVAADSVGD